VTIQKDYINGVIMTTALLFIPEIDDQLPGLLGFDQDAIIENFLIQESKSEYNDYVQLTDDGVEKKFNRDDIEAGKRGVNFSTYFITNSVEEDPNEHDYVQPFIVKENDFAHEIDPSNFITQDCLLQRIEWRFIGGASVKPQIGYLKLTKMNGGEVIIDFSGVQKVEQGDLHHLHGAFFISNFVMSSSAVDSLRVCGSPSGKELLTALDRYSLWDITSDAASILKRF